MFQVNFLPNRNDFSNRFSCFSFQKQRKQRRKKNCLLMVKRNQNTIGLDLVVETGGEKKTTTRSNQKCKCATISKCAQNAFNGYKNRQRQRLRNGHALRGHREQGDTNLVRLDIFKTAKVSGELSALVCCWCTDALAKPIFDLHGKIVCPSSPLCCYASDDALWRVAAATQTETVIEREWQGECAHTAPASAL